MSFSFQRSWAIRSAFHLFSKDLIFRVKPHSSSAATSLSSFRSWTWTLSLYSTLQANCLSSRQSFKKSRRSSFRRTSKQIFGLWTQLSKTLAWTWWRRQEASHWTCSWNCSIRQVSTLCFKEHWPCPLSQAVASSMQPRARQRSLVAHSTPQHQSWASFKQRATRTFLSSIQLSRGFLALSSLRLSLQFKTKTAKFYWKTVR